MLAKAEARKKVIEVSKLVPLFFSCTYSFFSFGFLRGKHVRVGVVVCIPPPPFPRPCMTLSTPRPPAAARPPGSLAGSERGDSLGWVVVVVVVAVGGGVEVSFSRYVTRYQV